MQLLILSIALLFVTHTLADPPYMWYATYSIENYQANGSCGRNDLWSCHDDADGFSLAVNGRNLSNTWYHYNRRDAACTANRWTGVDAEINYNDFVFYAGHGCGTGPIFGCNPGYPITNWEDIRFGGNGYLKWVQGATCSWFAEQQYDPCQSGVAVMERWTSCFRGVHAVQGHRAVTWDHVYSIQMSQQFWNDWCTNNQSLYWSWRNSQVLWVYEAGGFQGLMPATAAHNTDYGLEYFAEATDDPAPDGMNWLLWTVVGYPLY